MSLILHHKYLRTYLMIYYECLPKIVKKGGHISRIIGKKTSSVIGFKGGISERGDNKKKGFSCNIYGITYR